MPVTVAQYAAFIETGGYRERHWWTPNGLEWLRGRKERQPWRWREPPFNSRPRQAVMEVTWYEAAAFCAWLAAQLARDLPRGYTLRLPSEAEWEAAAAYDAAWRRRTYPWGEEEPAARYAVFDSEVGRGPAGRGNLPRGRGGLRRPRPRRGRWGVDGRQLWGVPPWGALAQGRLYSWRVGRCC